MGFDAFAELTAKGIKVRRLYPYSVQMHRNNSEFHATHEWLKQRDYDCMIGIQRPCKNNQIAMQYLKQGNWQLYDLFLYRSHPQVDYRFKDQTEALLFRLSV